MEQEDTQVLESITTSPTASTLPSITVISPATSITSLSNTSLSTKRKLKRFKSDLSPAPSTPQSSTPIPTTPPLPPATPPLVSSSSSSSSLSSFNPTTPPLISPSLEDDFIIPTPITSFEDTKEQDPNAPTLTATNSSRRILKINKSAKIKEEIKETITQPTIPVIVQPGTMRADGTMRKEVKIRAKQVPKVSLSSPEKPKKRQTKRIRPNTNFLTRLVKSSERHNANLSIEESELEYMTMGSDGNTSSEEYGEIETEDSDEYYENDTENNNNYNNNTNGDSSIMVDDSGNLSCDSRSNISNIVENAAREARKERRFIMHQVNRMRQKEGILLIKNLAKLYGLHVTIAEEGKSNNNNNNNNDSNNNKDALSRIVKSVGKIGYNCD